MRILLVEDDPMIGDAIHGALNDASYATDWVKNGLTALAALETQHYDLVLLDLGLPGKDGLDVLTRIRANNNPVPLLIITAGTASMTGCAASMAARMTTCSNPSTWPSCWRVCARF